MPLPRWVAMWGVAVAVYAGCKLVSLVARREGEAPARWHAAYLFAWPGMNPDAFLFGPVASSIIPTPTQWAFAIAKTVFGLAVLNYAAGISGSANPLVAGWVGMVGIAFVLHFGLFHVLACVWRQAGRNAEPIMHWPIASKSVSEFWGKRWNLAFRDLAHRFFFKPLRPRFGPAGAAFVSFLFSGVVHDMVISIPAGGGWGLPTLYFLIQTAGVSIERSKFGRGLGLNHGIRGRLFCAAIIVLPLPLLFHAPFLRSIVVPFLQAIESVT